MIRKAIMSLMSNVSLKSNMKSTERKNKQMVHEQKQMILNGKYKCNVIKTHVNKYLTSLRSTKMHIEICGYSSLYQIISRLAECREICFYFCDEDKTTLNSSYISMVSFCKNIKLTLVLPKYATS